MEPVRGVARRDRQGGRRSWWSKDENLLKAQQQELRDLVAAAEKEEDDQADAAPKRPQRRGTRRISWWGNKDNEAAVSQLKELQAAAEEEASEHDHAPVHPQRRGTRRISWWGNGGAHTKALEEMKQADADLSDLEKEEEAIAAGKADEDLSSEQGVTVESAEEPVEKAPDDRRLPRRVASISLSVDQGKHQRKKWWKKKSSSVK